MVRPYAVKGRKRKKREVEVEEEEQSAEETHEEEEDEEKTEIGEVEGERDSGEAPFELPGIPILPSNQKPKAGVIFVLERASLEVAKVGKVYTFMPFFVCFHEFIGFVLVMEKFFFFSITCCF